MSGSQDGKSSKRRYLQALGYRPDENGLWDTANLQSMVDSGVNVPTGARFRAPTSATELASWGFAGGGAGPDPMIGLDEWLRKNNMSLQQFQEKYGGLPLVFNSDGTATYDPSAQRQSFSYLNPDDGAFHKIAPLMFAALTGAGLAGIGQAATPLSAPAAGAGSLADFSLATAGQGIGGVGTAGLGLNTAGIGLTPELIAAGGGAGAMGIGGGLGLQAVSTLGEPLLASTMGSAASSMPVPTEAPGIAQSPAPVQNITTPGTLPGTTNVPAGTMNPGSWWESLLNPAQGTKTGLSALQTFLKGGGSLLEWLQSKDNADQLRADLSAAADRGDPFASQRPYYQNMLKESYSDPNFWKNNAVFKGISDVASSDAQRQAAARGFNNSSNVLYDVADRIQKTGMNYATNFQGQLAQNAGAGFSPGTSASIAANGANQVQSANQQSNGALGNVISNIPNVINGIKGILA